MEENLKEKKYLEKIQGLEEEIAKLKSLIGHKPETQTLGSQTEELEKISPSSENDREHTISNSAGSSGSVLSQAGFQPFHFLVQRYKMYFYTKYKTKYKKTFEAKYRDF